MKFSSAPNTSVQSSLNHLFQNQCSLFLLLPLRQKVILSPKSGSTNRQTNSVDYHHSPSGLTSGICPLTFLQTRKGFIRIFAVEITAKCTRESKTMNESMNLEFYTRDLLQGSYHTAQAEGNCSSAMQSFFENPSSNQKWGKGKYIRKPFENLSQNVFDKDWSMG